MRDVRIGTASWTDPEFIKAGWYPSEVKDDAEGRLRYYAARFPMVEVNASFYALPTVETTAAWAERTPASSLRRRPRSPDGRLTAGGESVAPEGRG